MSSRRSRHLLVPLVAGLMLLMVLPVPTAEAASVTTLTLTSQGKTLNANALAVAPEDAQWLSGRVNITASVTIQAGETESLGTTARLIYRTDGGTPASPGSATDCPAPNTCITLTSGEDVPTTPGGSMTYTGTIAANALAGAPTAAQVTFRIQAQLFPPGVQNLATVYRFLLDKSAPRVESFSIPAASGSSVPHPVTNSTTPVLEFNVRDDPAESRLLPTDTFVVRINNVVETQNFTIQRLSDFDIRFRYVYALGDRQFLEGDHTLQITVQDQALNTPAPFRFAVDLTPPVVGDVTATPQEGLALNGLFVTSPGTPVNITAIATDPHLNVNAPNVQAAFRNATRGLQSPFAGLTVFNVTTGEWRGQVPVPSDFPAEPMDLSVRIRAVDQAGNEALFDSPLLLRIDPHAPVVVDEDPGGFIAAGPHLVRAVVTDNGTGLREDGVRIHFVNATGEFTGSTDDFEFTDDFFTRVMDNPQGNTWEATIPAAEHGAEITYFISAFDLAGNIGLSELRHVTVDGEAPQLEEIPPRPYRGGPPQLFELTVTDGFSGVDPDSANLFYATAPGAPFQMVAMVRSEVAEDEVAEEDAAPIHEATFVATIEADLAEGATIRYYYEAQDRAGNVGTRGTASSPLTSIIDLTPPTFSLEAPAEATGPTFTIAWSGQDPPLSDGRPGSGGLTFDIFARKAGDAQWVRILHETPERSLSVCARADVTYEFTGLARDGAGNTADRSETPLGTTALTGASCREEIHANVTAPRITQAVPVLQFDGQAGAGTLEVRWNALSSITVTPTESLRINILFSSDNALSFWPVATGLENTGAHDLPMDLPPCARCFIRVQAVSLTGVAGEATSSPFELFNAVATADLDGNGLFDAWEVEHFSQVGVADPNDDQDGDGLTNREESLHGTNPFLWDTDGDGFSDGFEVKVGTDPLDPNDFPDDVQARSIQYTHWYWSVPAVAAVAAGVFFIGLARRW